MMHKMTAAKAGDAHLAALKNPAMPVQHQTLTPSYNDVLLLMAARFNPIDLAFIADCQSSVTMA
jgi:hypothetical protein